MSVESKAAKGAAWLAIFQLSSQIVSWSATIIVARILVPSDYGLMEMATIITGYAFIFNELGLGQAIVQCLEISDEQLSSVFWFSMILSVIFALFAFFIAYPTSLIFNEPKIIPITKATSILFILSGLQIVPGAMLRKEMKFHAFGSIGMISVLTSCIFMVVIAKLGAGVWTLIGGHIIRSFTRSVLLFIVIDWRPNFSFRFSEAKYFIKFGVLVAIGRSLFYIYEKSDRFFAGKFWSPKILGQYSFALQLAMIPTDKIVPIINQVAYSAFSSLQNDKQRFKDFYLNISKVTSAIVFPIFCGGFLIGNDLIKLLLTKQWYPMIPLFRYLCIVQIVVAMTAVNGFVHSARGRPGINIILNALLAIFMPVSFYFSIHYGIKAILIPWFTTYIFINFFWLLYTLKEINISFYIYLRSLKYPLMATFLMLTALIFIDYFMNIFPYKFSIYCSLPINVLSGASIYILFFLLFDRKFITNLIVMFKK